MEGINEPYINFLHIWHETMWYLFLVAAAISILIFLSYQVKYATTKDYKSRFDLASQFEIKRLQQANYVLAAGIFFFLNTVYDDTVALSPIWLFIRAFVSFCIGTLHVYISYLIFKYYYPGPLNKKLKKLRYSPRINPSTGNTMKLLSEEEEDAYLDEGMQAEEDAFSVDYDVWIDPQTEETLIEKYKGHLSALECDRCGFQTLKLQKEEILEEATEFSDGKLEKEYKCSYCGRIKRKTVKLSRKMERSTATAHMVDNPLAAHTSSKTVRAVVMEIKSTDGESKFFEFQNIDQAKNFLQEFDYSKLED